jgi:FHA domain
MALEPNQSKDVDLDSTDKLPILEGEAVGDDVGDDAVRLEHTADLSSSQAPVIKSAPSEFARPSVDLPSLAESVRSVEERIARQNAAYEALRRVYEKARDAEAAAVTRAAALAAELSEAQSALAVEQHRSRELDRALGERKGSADAARARIEEAVRTAERYQIEARTMRESLAARDATIVQVLHSLGERDAQLYALQREHAATVPALEARSQISAQLEAELQAARGRIEAITLELNDTQQTAAGLNARLAHGASEMQAAQQELGTVKRQAGSYLEILRTREWRRGFDQNMFREWDAKMDAARAGHGALQVERDRLKQTAAALSGKLIEQEEAIAKLQKAAAADASALNKRAQELQESNRARAELQARIDALEADCKQLQSELAARDQAIAEARAQGSGEVQQGKELLAQAEKTQAELRAQIVQLEAEAATHEEELTVLMAHLNEARRPTQSIHADVKRLTDELALKNLGLEQLNEDNQNLRTALERTRGALEEREFLIRRLERSESNNANVLGRLQTSIEKLGAPPPPSAPAFVAECCAELTRIDGENNITYTLARRTRIGRAPGCELHVDSSSVSRHHALLLKNAHELIIEDLNSTNGVVVNGRKISRQLLNDGDLVTIGDIQFRCSVKSAPSLGPERASEGITTLNTGACVAELRPAEIRPTELRSPPDPPAPEPGPEGPSAA